MNNKKSNFKRIVALIGVIILILMVIATFVVAILNFEGSERIFDGLLICDIALPILLWGYLIIYRWAEGRDKELAKKIEDIDNKE